MDPRLLHDYEQELRYLRELGGEFAREFPKIAGRLGLEEFACADPYVERLLEGAAFLAARVRLKVDAEFPCFTQHLLQLIYPHYLAPTPSLAVVQLQPDLADSGLAAGPVLPRGTSLYSRLGSGDRTPCEYRTAHPVTLWPLELDQASYLGSPAALSTLGLPLPPSARAAVRLQLRCTAGLNFTQLALDRLPLYLRGGDSLPLQLYEQLIGHALDVIARPDQPAPPWPLRLGANVRPLGFDDEQALLPVSARGFQGYRLLHEYFAFPPRYLFVELTGLAEAVRRCTSHALQLVILLNHSLPALEGVFSRDHVALFCAPAGNLFPKRTDRIHLSDRTPDYHIVPDRTRPLDFEVYQVNRVTGYGTSAQEEQEFLPFYANRDQARQRAGGAFYTVHRLPRLLSSRQRRHGTRTSYIGSEVYLSLVDSAAAPYRSDLRQLGLETLCTNRDLPLLMPLGQGTTDFTLEVGLPIQAIRCVAGPTPPRPAWAERDQAWRLLSHLSLNYLSLLDQDEAHGAVALRDLLALYADISDLATRKQIEGLHHVHATAITRRLPLPGPIAFGRGLKIELTCDETAFAGGSAFLLGCVLEQFFARYVSLNSFTETTLISLQRGELRRWPARIGRRQTL